MQVTYVHGSAHGASSWQHTKLSSADSYEQMFLQMIQNM